MISPLSISFVVVASLFEGSEASSISVGSAVGTTVGGAEGTGVDVDAGSAVDAGTGVGLEAGVNVDISVEIGVTSCVDDRMGSTLLLRSKIIPIPAASIMTNTLIMVRMLQKLSSCLTVLPPGLSFLLSL